jgi:predicted TIM-barrel fold metal-dependent hydrolase
MLIVDSQVHIWKSGTPVIIHRQIPQYTKEDLLKEMAAGGVDATVLCPPSWDPNANEIAVEAAAAHPDKFCVLGGFDPKDPASRARITKLREEPGMLGLRFAFLRKGEDTWLTDGTMDWVWAAAEKEGLPVALLVPGKLKILEKIAQKHPGLKLFIDHMARVRHTVDEAAFADLDELLGLAKYPNVAVKASGAPSYSSDVYPYRNIHKYLHRIFDAFGPQRMFWGTDITRMPCTLRQCVTMYTEEMPWLKGRDLELVMGGAICEWLAWKVPAASRGAD